MATTDILARKRIWKDRDPARERKAIDRAKRIEASRRWQPSEPALLGHILSFYPPELHEQIRAGLRSSDDETVDG